MSLDDIVSVDITAATMPRSQTGFSTILAAVYHTEFVDLIRSYTSIRAVAEDFPTEHPAYLMAAKMFSQSPRPKRIKIGKRTAAPVQTVRLTPVTTTEGAVYRFEVAGQEIEYTVPAAASVASICTALVSLINALVGLFTAADNTTHITVTADTAADVDAILVTGASTTGVQTFTGAALDGVIGNGFIRPGQRVTLTFNSHSDWDATNATVAGFDRFGDALSETLAIPNGGNATVTSVARFGRVTSITIPAQSGTNGTFTAGVVAPAGSLFDFWTDPTQAEMTITDLTADPGLAANLTTLRAADTDWYGLALDSNSEAESAVAAAWAEADVLLLGVNSADSGVLAAGTTTDVFSDLESLGYARTFGIWSGHVLSYAAAGLLAKRLTTQPGEATWCFASLAGVAADVLTDTKKSAIEGKTANHYTEVGGVDIVWEGKTFAGEYIDVTVFLDWLRIGMQEDLFAAISTPLKVPYTDAGAGIVESVMQARLARGIAVGGLAADPAPIVTVPKVADVDVADRANRHLPDCEFEARLAGAIHKLTVSGRVTV